MRFGVQCAELPEEYKLRRKARVWSAVAVACLSIGEHAHMDEVWSASDDGVGIEQEAVTAAELLHLKIINSSRYERLNDAEAPAGE